MAGSMSFVGVNASNPVGNVETFADSGTQTTITVSSAAGRVVVDFAGADKYGGVLIAGSGQAERLNVDEGAVSAGGSTKPGSSSVTMTWDLEAYDQWAVVAVELLI